MKIFVHGQVKDFNLIKKGAYPTMAEESGLKLVQDEFDTRSPYHFLKEN